MYLYPVLGVVGVSIVLLSFFGAQYIMKGSENDIIPATDTKNLDTAMFEIPSEAKQEVQITDGVRHIIPLDKIRSGGPPKDGIPSIDNPQFAKISDAQFVRDSDVVIGLEINGDARAYPLFILVWHEIVNDIVGDTPVSITYCPLCYTSQVFERTLNDQAVEFGTSGKLYNSNLLMYDRLTDSYWSQSLGTAVKGNLTEMKLETIPFDLITWKDWKSLHPETLVLTTDTGHIRSYGVDPYGDYYTEPQIIFPVENLDDRFDPKEIIIGLNYDNVFKAFPQRDISIYEAINDNIGNKPVLLVSKFEKNARVFERTVDEEILEFSFVDGKLKDNKTNSIWDYDGIAISGPMQGQQLTRLSIHPGFWFEWAAFHPNTLVYGEG